MKKNTLLAIVVLVAVVIAFSLLPLTSAKKPSKPATLMVTLSGALATVDNCGDLNPTGVDVVRGPKGTLESTGPVAIQFTTFTESHARDPGHGDPLNLPSCLGAELLRVEFYGTDLVFVQLIRMDGFKDKIQGVTHDDAFFFAAHEIYPGTAQEVDGYFDSFIRHGDSHKGKQHPPDHSEIAFRLPLAITGDLS